MPEAALPRLDPERRARLAALGLELLALRAELAPAAGAGAVRLGVAGAAWPSGDRLLCAVIGALGVPAERIVAGPAAGGITLQVGAAAAGPDAVALPDPAALRDPHAKRALWPALRALRRRLVPDAAG